ncbi:hypothetical protein [Tateyamaria sp.]|uniref:hypothetical protein n=1 Tax=Tateyamaria sp. TaxID=1929288 RepID=UPI0032A0AE0E
MLLQDKTNPEDSGLTSAIIDHLALHRAKPGPDKTDHRPLPQPDQVELRHGDVL